MLIRFVLENVFSFGERKEFNMLPYKRSKTLKHHCYDYDSVKLLKMAAIYGANGAGKSNMVKAISFFKDLVVKQSIPKELKESQFKFNAKEDLNSQLLAIEFVQDSIPFYYGIELDNGIVATEELYQSGLGKTDKLLFERKTDVEGNSHITFMETFEADEKSQLLKDILLEEFVKPNESILKMLSNRENPFLQPIKKAFKWFVESLVIVTPVSRPTQLAHLIDIHSDFQEYAKQLICSLNIGITDLTSEKIELKEFMGENEDQKLNQLKEIIDNRSDKTMSVYTEKGHEIVITKEEEKYWVKSLKIEHTGKRQRAIQFDLDDESDGTIRLLDFIPAFKQLISESHVYIIDEMERSIHPLLIKELVKKFSEDTETKGQLVFTTHESNLLDQDIFRQDEIWFAEKDQNGSTDLYSMSKFKEHKTIDIQKGYLKGRYGAIPFLGNLKDLNWQTHVAH